MFENTDSPTSHRLFTADERARRQAEFEEEENSVAQSCPSMFKPLRPVTTPKSNNA